MDEKAPVLLVTDKSMSQFRAYEDTSRVRSETGHERLYNLHKEKSITRRQEEYKSNKEQSEVKECTFTPQILGSPGKAARTFAEFLSDQKKFCENKSKKIEQAVEDEEKKVRDMRS
jgi:hypothetical protein